LPRGER